MDEYMGIVPLDVRRAHLAHRDVPFFVLGAITTVTERRHIHSKRASRVVSDLFTFPVFMMTYIPITIVALFKKVEWVPTKHDIAVSFEDVVSADEGSGK